MLHLTKNHIFTNSNGVKGLTNSMSKSVAKLSRAVKYHAYSFKWSTEYREYQKVFAIADPDDLRGKNCARLDLNGNSEKAKIWKDYIVKSLKIDSSKVKDWSRVNVAMHYWTPK